MTYRPRELSTSEARNHFIRRMFWAGIITSLAIFALLAAAGVAAGQEQEEGRGGFISPTPSWFVKVKSSETPLRRNSDFYEFSGSGSWIAPDLVLTCWHNVRYKLSTKISPRICIEDHLGYRYTNVEIAAVNKRADLLVLRVLGKTLPHSQVRVSTQPETYGTVYSWGLDSDGKRLRWTVGSVLKNENGTDIRSAPGFDGKPVWHHHDGLVVKGMSGGPGFDESGELQCVNTGHGEGRSSCVSLSTIQELLDTIDR